MRVGLNRLQRRAWKARARHCDQGKGRGVVIAHEKSDDPTKPTPFRKVPCPGCSPFVFPANMEILKVVEAAVADAAAAAPPPAPLAVGDD